MYFSNLIKYWKYSAFKERGHWVLNEDRVARFSATTLPFHASENTDVRYFPHISFFTCTHL
jgi:hypothetical protein